MTISHISFNAGTQHGSQLRNALTHLEQGVEGLGDVLAVKDREDDDRRREERWMAHDTKRDETLRLIADKTSAALDRNSEALARNDTNIRRCEDRHASPKFNDRPS